PAEVEQKLSGVKAKMLAKVDEAEQAYNAGYALYQRYRFAEAIPHLQKALGIIELPEFAVALGQALQELPRPREAETVYRQALQRATAEKDEKYEAIFSNQLGRVLRSEGNLPEARTYMGRALAIDEKVYGPEHPTVAIRASNLGLILQDQGDLRGARRYAEQALAIDEKVYGPEHPTVATRASNLGLILQDQGDLP